MSDKTARTTGWDTYWTSYCLCNVRVDFAGLLTDSFGLSGMDRHLCVGDGSVGMSLHSTSCPCASDGPRDVPAILR